LLQSGKVLVVGGYTRIGSPGLSTAEIYDPATGQWTAVALMHHVRTGHAAVLIEGGKVLVVGGNDAPPLGISPGGSAPAHIAPEIYDPSTDTWSVMAMPVLDRPVHPTATLLRDGRVLVVGGQYMLNSPDESAERSELFSPTSDAWSSVPPETRGGARQFHSATLLATGQVLIAGGMRSLHPIGSAVLYDPTSNAWIPVPDMTENRCGQAAQLLPTGKRVLMVGSGCGWAEQSAIAEEYDSGSNRWFAVASLAAPRGRIVAVVLADGRVVAFGGSMPAGNPTDVVEVFIPG
jgi:hypothetical protein